MQHVVARAGEGAHVAGLHLAAQGRPGFLGVEAGIDRHGRRFVGEENPVADFFGQLPPGLVHVMAERDEDVAQVLSVPGRRPGRDGALADGQ